MKNSKLKKNSTDKVENSNRTQKTNKCFQKVTL